MSENWHEERDRLVRLLAALESGEVTDASEQDRDLPHAATPDNVEKLKERLAELNDRLG